MTSGKAKKPFRFALVGIANTLVDIGIYTLLSYAGWGILITNTISTSCGMLLSFFLNRSFTFNATSEKKGRQVILFIVITLTSQWIIQPIIITFVASILQQFYFLQTFWIIAPKICAIAVSLVWNYFFYSRVVFAVKESE